VTHIRRAVQNRLPEKAAKLNSFNSLQSDEWEISGVGDFTTDRSVFGPDDSYNQLYCTGVPSEVGSSMDLSIYALQLNPEDDANYFELAFYAKMPAGGTIEIIIADTTTISVAESTTTFSVPVASPSPNAVGLADPSWRCYRSKPTLVDKGEFPSPRIDVTIKFTPNQPDSVVYFANPSVIGMMDHMYFSEAVKNIVPNMPEAMFENAMDSEPPAAISRFIDVMYSGLDIAAKALRDYRFFSLDEGRDLSKPETLSNLVWPSNTDFPEARWLAQFSGTQPASKLNTVLDPSDPFVLDQSQLNGDDTLRFSSTVTIQSPQATVEVVTDFLRWQAEYGYYGINAGTTRAIMEAVKRVMIGDKEVTITSQHEGPFTMLVETPWEQTYGGAVELIGESSVVADEAISYAKPVGLKVTHRLV
jgi:hypothetical protein